MYSFKRERWCLSPYETHAWSQNSLSSSQRHKLLMIRPERHWNTHCVSQSDGGLNPCLTARLCERVCLGRIHSLISRLHDQAANQKADDDSTVLIGSGALLSWWQQPVTSFSLSPMSPLYVCVCFVFLLHITTLHMCDAIISSVCWRNACVYNEPCSLHRHVHSKLLQRVHSL